MQVEPPARKKVPRKLTLGEEHACYRSILCLSSFEDRFFDPDHPKDSDWVADIDYDRLFRMKAVRANRPTIPSDFSGEQNITMT
jgi:hypothetical protein